MGFPKIRTSLVFRSVVVGVVVVVVVVVVAIGIAEPCSNKFASGISDS